MLVTASGKKKLDSLLGELKVLQAKYKAPKKKDTKETSEYSQAMIEKVAYIIKVLTYDPFIPLADLAYLTLKKDEILEAIAFLDNKQSTNIPVIYNAESHELAQLILRHMNGWDLRKDFSDTVLNALSGFNIDNLFQTMRFNLQHKVKMYDVFVDNATQEKEMKKIMDKVFVKGEELKTATMDESFITSMRASLKSLIDEASQLAYVRLANADYFINQAKPMIWNS